MTSAAQADITISTDRSVGLITLQRVGALNALTGEMRRAIAAAIPNFARDPQIYAVVLQSTSPRAFSTGSDVREIVQAAQRSHAEARAAFAEEYRMNWLLECFSKPTISLSNGLTMGGGVGISGFNTHRVAGEAYSWAMPETMIGLFPDVGAVHALSRLGAVGQYLALTGRSVGRADAFRLGLASHCIGAEHFPRIVEEMALANPVDPLLDGLHEDPGAGELEALGDVIKLAFSAAAVEDIVSRLDAVQGANRAWAQGVVGDLRKRSPTSLKVTHRYLKEAATFDIQKTLITDYRVVCRFLEGGDFYEGVRAAIIDKDGAPSWKPASLRDVSAELVDRYFAPMASNEELQLASREDMQKARV